MSDDTPVSSPVETPAGAERRRTPRRRLRDRIASLESTENPSLHRHELKNHVMLVEDDLRQTALALGAIEAYLTQSMELLEDEALTSEAMRVHAEDETILDRFDTLSENLDQLRRRMRSIAAAMSHEPGSRGPRT